MKMLVVFTLRWNIKYRYHAHVWCITMSYYMPEDIHLHTLISLCTVLSTVHTVCRGWPTVVEVAACCPVQDACVI